MRIASVVLCALLMLGVAAAAEQPNFVLILLDDSGWTDFGCYGSRIQTPHIDRFVREGMRFTDCHSAAPNCSPSRAGLLTGRTPSRVGVYSYLPANHVMHLRSEEVTLAELLKSAGYRTGHFGKWHLSRLRSDQPQPSDQGFDYSLGTDNNASPSHINPTNFVRNGKPVGEMKGYSCKIVVDETIRWLDRIDAGNKQTGEVPSIRSGSGSSAAKRCGSGVSRGLRSTQGPSDRDASRRDGVGTPVGYSR